MTRVAGKFKGLVLAAVVALVVSGCSESGSPSSQPTSDPDSRSNEITEPESAPEDDSSAEAPAVEVSIPAGAIAASSDFPFPVPEGWAELDEFAESKIGKDISMSASYEYPGDPKEAAELYENLLKDAGYTIHPDLLGSTVHGAAFLIEGPVNGIAYGGGIYFNSHADGFQRASIMLVPED